MTYLGDANMSIEVGSIYFDNTDSGTLTFEMPFDDATYQVIVSARDSGDVGGVDVNIYVDSVNSTRSLVVVKSSTAFTGYVDVFAVKIE